LSLGGAVGSAQIHAAQGVHVMCSWCLEEPRLFLSRLKLSSHRHGLVPLLFVFMLVALASVGLADTPELFANPFQTADAYRTERTTVPDATYRLNYEIRGKDLTGRNFSEMAIFTLAADWALLEEGDRSRLFDFKLMRVFQIDTVKKTFRSDNLNALVLFKVGEREHRALIEAGIRASGLTERFAGSCDAETELGIAFPESNSVVQVTLSAGGDMISATCNGRRSGVIKLNSENLAPATLWPMLALNLPVHPKLLAAARELGRTPAQIDSTFRQVNRDEFRTWKLVSEEQIRAPYPLDGSLNNATNNRINGVSAKIMEIAEAAINGAAGSGPPDAVSWELFLKKLVVTDPPAAVLTLTPTFDMFPESLSKCTSDPYGTFCEIRLSAYTLTKSTPALRKALLALSFQSTDTNAVTAILDAMMATRDTPYAQHPALIGIYAVKLIEFGGPLIDAAAEVGLDHDPIALLSKVLTVYPYDPVYWHELARHSLMQWDYSTAFLYIDTVMTLPIQEAHPLLIETRQRLLQMYNDFPSFYLQ